MTLEMASLEGKALSAESPGIGEAEVQTAQRGTTAGLLGCALGGSCLHLQGHCSRYTGFSLAIRQLGLESWTHLLSTVGEKGLSLHSVGELGGLPQDLHTPATESLVPGLGGSPAQPEAPPSKQRPWTSWLGPFSLSRPFPSAQIPLLLGRGTNQKWGESKYYTLLETQNWGQQSRLKYH
jgi:hypothetical protein